MAGGTEVPVKKQVESSKIQIGFCRYCGQSYQLETSGVCNQEILDEWAAEKCDCEEAKEERKQKAKETKAVENIKKLFGEYDTAPILMAAVHSIAIHAVDSVTVNIGNGTKAVIKNKKGKIQVQKTITRTDVKEN